MSERFENLKKIPDEPAARMMAMAKVKFQYAVTSPASADVPTVLKELDEAKAIFDMVNLLAVALPAREAVWWSCLAARDLVGEASAPPLEAAEAWVHEPNDDNRDAAQYAAQDAEIDDDTPLCALAALYADGTMGTGVLAEHPAPVGAVAHLVAGMNLLALDAMADDAPDHGTVLVDRALDIARGGNGRLDKE